MTRPPGRRENSRGIRATPSARYPTAKFSLAFRPLLAVASGVILALSFPYPGWGFLGAVALVSLVWSLRGLGWWRRGSLGFLCGVVFYSFLVYWLVYVHPAAAPLLCLWLSLWLALFGILCGPLRSPTALVLWMPIAWVCVEYLRSIGPLGFAWGLLGHTQWRNLPLIQIASVTGVYGISFLLAMASGGLAAFSLWFRHRDGRRVPILVLPFVLIALVWIGGSVSLDSRDEEASDSIRIALLQVCFSQQEKWDEEEMERVKDRTYRMTGQAAGRGVDLIVWPETALPVTLNEWHAVEEELIGELNESDVPILVGTLLEHGTDVRTDTRNAVMLFRPGMSSWAEAQRYEKMHLVPWGEYVPLAWLLPFVDRMVTEEGGGGLSPGEAFTVFELDGARLATPICFESAVANLVRGFVLRGAGLLINVTNDAWFRESSAQDQHLIQSVFRAVENRRAMARAANTGRTCWIAPTGEVMDRLPLYDAGILVADVPLRSDSTFYTRHGDVFARLVLVAAAALMVYALLRKRRLRGKTAE